MKNKLIGLILIGVYFFMLSGRGAETYNDDSKIYNFNTKNSFVNSAECETIKKGQNIKTVLVNGETSNAASVCKSSTIEYFASGNQILNTTYFFNPEVNSVAEDSVNIWMNQPSAVYFEGQSKRTYFAYSNTLGQVLVNYFDHNLKVYGASVVVATFTGYDDHLSPSIEVVNNGPLRGTIIMAFSFHSSPLFVTHTSSPEDISSFSTPIEVVSERTTYPNIIETSSGAAIYFRGHPEDVPSSKGILQSIESQDLATWSQKKDIVNFDVDDFIYHRIKKIDNRLLLSWSVFKRNSKTFENIYFAYSDDDGQFWNYFNGNYWEGTDVLNSSIPPIFSGENFRVYDLINYDERFYISAAQYDNEYSCCSGTSVSHIIKIENSTLLRSSYDISQEYYASGSIFDNNVEGAVYSLEKNNEENLVTFRLFDRSLKQETNGTIIRTGNDIGRISGIKNSRGIGKFTYLNINYYQSYLDFNASVEVVQ